ncbi:hypothetical protein E2I00_003450 [Balaenoptera physalus]|uniref:Uncharacterized protein n=1 Tax=Balaenoptera physalus TaxID=9770 RepID=A0A643C4B2_BALPH|nr:hypothetical protein E2I00_003450 [Balaenoptera physalus]
MARKVVGRPPEETLSLWKREQALLKTLVVDRDTEAWQRDPAFSEAKTASVSSDSLILSFPKDLTLLASLSSPQVPRAHLCLPRAASS